MGQERVSGFPGKGANLRGSPGNFRGSLGDFRGSLGNFRGRSGLPLSSTVRELPGKPPGKFGELPGKSGDFPEAQGSLTRSQRLAKLVSSFSALIVYLCTQASRLPRLGAEAPVAKTLREAKAADAGVGVVSSIHHGASTWI